MNSLDSAFNHSGVVPWLALLVVVVILLIWVARVHARARRLEGRIEDALGGVTGENSARMLAEYLGTVRATAATVSRIRAEHDALTVVMPGVVRHVGLVRFSPFHDTGGDQSFTLAVLDGKHNGVVITGLHSRHDSRLYAKPIERGSSSYALTSEEREAISRAVSGESAEAEAVPSAR